MSTAAHGHEGYTLEDAINRQSLDHANSGGEGDEHDHIHLASLAEKKRLWWRNAVINAVFIASW